ncbi:indolethylamine N-methyltransferase-like [Spea bombifrons]|uniref:indolethylamine N-methyltransferase-like n=1 Tax=Spea bombifrons TaxID=233779 RepID=UPI00234A42B2|nr:indolethylamine N-methyltransferase-like [Spea bombifrons]
MDSKDLKYYHRHELDAKDLLHKFFSPKSDKLLLEESTAIPMKYLYKEFSSGRIKGDSLIEFGYGPCIHHLLAICEFVKEITLLEFNDVTISELEKWLNNHEESFDWSHASKLMIDLEGKSGGWQEKEELLRGKIKQILKCDITKDNITDPVVLPKADVIISMWGLDILSTTKDEYVKNLRKIASLLKPGGRMILVSDINVTFYMAGGHKYGILTYDEEFLKTTLKNEEFVIETYEAYDRKADYDVIDHEKVIYITALKQK